MLSFLWWVTGSVHLKVPAEDDARLLREIATYLVAKRVPGRKVEVGPDYVEFREFPYPPSRGSSALAWFDRGRISIDRRSDKALLRYALRRLHAFVFCAFLGVMITGLAVLDPKSASWWFGLAVFLVTYGANVVFCLVGVPLRFRKWAHGEGTRQERDGHHKI